MKSKIHKIKNKQIKINNSNKLLYQIIKRINKIKHIMQNNFFKNNNRRIRINQSNNKMKYLFHKIKKYQNNKFNLVI